MDLYEGFVSWVLEKFNFFPISTIFSHLLRGWVNDHSLNMAANIIGYQTCRKENAGMVNDFLGCNWVQGFLLTYGILGTLKINKVLSSFAKLKALHLTDHLSIIMDTNKLLMNLEVNLWSNLPRIPKPGYLKKGSGTGSIELVPTEEEPMVLVSPKDTKCFSIELS